MNRYLILILLFTQMWSPKGYSADTSKTSGKIMDNTVYSFTARTIEGNDISLDKYKGKVLIIVNTASKCGYTPQFDDLEKIYQKYKKQGLEILGFPCNQFANQDPGTTKEIADFCRINYGVTFQMFDKIDVNGKNAHPLYKYLKTDAPGVLGTENIKWNFTKFLIDRDGRVVGRYAPQTKPEELIPQIEELLN